MSMGIVVDCIMYLQDAKTVDLECLFAQKRVIMWGGGGIKKCYGSNHFSVQSISN